MIVPLVILLIVLVALRQAENECLRTRKLLQDQLDRARRLQQGPTRTGSRPDPRDSFQRRWTP